MTATSRESAVDERLNPTQSRRSEVLAPTAASQRDPPNGPFDHRLYAKCGLHVAGEAVLQIEGTNSNSCRGTYRLCRGTLPGHQHHQHMIENTDQMLGRNRGTSRSGVMCQERNDGVSRDVYLNVGQRLYVARISRALREIVQFCSDERTEALTQGSIKIH